MNAKQKWNFLVAFVRQCREALDEGHELAYELGELIDELWQLQDPDEGTPRTGDGADVDEVPGPDLDGREGDGQADGGGLGSSQDSQPTLPGLVRGVERVPSPMYGDGRVPRGTRSRASSAVARKLVGGTGYGP